MSERFRTVLWASWLVAAVLVNPARAHKDLRPEDRTPLKPTDPMKVVSDQMKKAEQELSNSLTGNEAQAAQEQALQTLDRLIDQAEKQKKPNDCNQPQQEPQQNEQPNKNDQQQREHQKNQDQKEPQQDQEQKEQKDKEQDQKSQDPADQKRMRAQGTSDGDQGSLEAAGKEWGTMPPQLRQELIHSMHEDLPDRYKELLKSYYKKLSEMESE